MAETCLDPEPTPVVFVFNVFKNDFDSDSLETRRDRPWNNKYVVYVC